jgi:hypothetical protein
MVTQTVIKLLLPAIEVARLETVQATEFMDRHAGLLLLEDGELLFRENPAAMTAFNRWRLVHLHKDNQAFQTVQISTGADQLFYGATFSRSISSTLPPSRKPCSL